MAIVQQMLSEQQGRESQPNGQQPGGGVPGSPDPAAALVRLRELLWWVRPVFCVILGAMLGYVDLDAAGTSGFLRVPALLASLILVAQGPLEFDRHSRWGNLRRRLYDNLDEWRKGLATAHKKLDARESELAARERRLSRSEGADGEALAHDGEPAGAGESSGHDRDASEHDADSAHDGRSASPAPDGRTEGTHIHVEHAETVYAAAPPSDITSTMLPTDAPAPDDGTAVPQPDAELPEADRLRREITRLEEEIEVQRLLARAIRGTSDENRNAVLIVLILAVWLGLATLTYSAAPALLLRLALLAAFLLFASAWGMLQQESS
jgi:hypothetical protein